MCFICIIYCQKMVITQLEYIVDPHNVLKCACNYYNMYLSMGPCIKAFIRYSCTSDEHVRG